MRDGLTTVRTYDDGIIDKPPTLKARYVHGNGRSVSASTSSMEKASTIDQAAASSFSHRAPDAQMKLR